MPKRPKPIELTETRPGSNVWESSGNVFADLGLPDAEILQARMRLGFAVYEIIAQRKLSKNRAAKVLGISRKKVAALKAYRLKKYTVEGLMRMAAALGYEVIMEVREVETRT